MVPRLRDTRVLVSAGAHFTQPRVHSLADPCTSNLPFSVYLSRTLEAVDLVSGRFHLPHDPDHVPVGQLGEVPLRPLGFFFLEEGGEEVGVL